MDGLAGWAARLRRGRYSDGNGSVSVLTHYCRILRLLSGMQNSALLNLADGILEARSDAAHASALRARPEVQGFLSWLGGLDRTDQNTVWSIIAQDMFPTVPRGQSVFGSIGSARSVSDATEEVVRSSDTSLQLLLTILGEQEDGGQEQESTMNWEVPGPDDVLQVLLGTPVSQTVQEVCPTSVSQNVEGQMRSDSGGKGSDAVEEDSKAGGHGKDESLQERKETDAASDNPGRVVSSGPVPDVPQPDGDAMASEKKVPVGITDEEIEEKHRRNQEVQDKLQAAREAKREGAGKAKLKQLNREENRWREPWADAPFREKLAERPDLGGQKMDQEGCEIPKTNQEAAIPDVKESDKKGKKRTKSRSAKEEEAKRLRSDEHKREGKALDVAGANEGSIAAGLKRSNSPCVAEFTSEQIEEQRNQLGQERLRQ